jgi:hypothetical protein
VILRGSRLFKKIILWCLIPVSGLIAVYVAGVCFVSIWSGFSHMDRNGFWVPIAFGGVTFSVVIFLSFSFIRSMLAYIKDRDVLKH